MASLVSVTTVAVERSRWTAVVSRQWPNTAAFRCDHSTATVLTDTTDATPSSAARFVGVCGGDRVLVLCLHGGYVWCSWMMAGRLLCSVLLLSPLHRLRPDWSVFVVAAVGAVSRQWPDTAAFRRGHSTAIVRKDSTDTTPTSAVRLVGICGGGRVVVMCLHGGHEWCSRLIAGRPLLSLLTAATAVGTPSSAARLVSVCGGGSWCCVSMVANHSSISS